MAVGGELSTATAVASLATAPLSAHPGENPPPRSPCHGVNDACVVLLLTTAVQRSFHNHVGMRNSSVRQMWYKKSLDMWHGDTAWRNALVVVENGGFDEWNKEYPSFEVLTFVHSRAQQRIFCDNNSVIDGRSPYAGGHHELVSIRYAFRYSVRLTAAATTHVLKLTGRYYVPAMDSHLLAANLTHRTASIRQAPTPLAAMPCETFGCRLRTFAGKHQSASPKIAEAWSPQGWTVCDMMFRCPYAKVQCEAQMKYRIMRKEMLQPHQAILPRMPVMPTVRGTTNMPVDEL